MPLNQELINKLKAKGILPKVIPPVGTQQTTITPEMPAKDFLTRMGGAVKETGRFFGEDILGGLVKGVGRTATGMSELGEKGLQSILGINQPTGVEQLNIREKLQATTPGQKGAMAAEQIAEFLLPGQATKKLVTSMGGVIPGKVGSLTRGAGTVLSEAGLIGGQTALQTGEFGKEAGTAALIGGTTAGVLPLIQKGLNKLGGKIMISKVKGTSPDIRAGYNPENITKYNLGGDLRTVLTKTDDEISNRYNQVKIALKSIPDEKINLKTAYEAAKDELMGGEMKFRKLAQKTELENAFKDIEAKILKGNSQIVNPWEGTLIKQSAGEEAAFNHGLPIKGADITEEAWNTFYLKLKSQIENIGDKTIKKLNKEISELLPIKFAILRRLPVEERQNIVSLLGGISAVGALATGHPAALGVLAAEKALKSGRVGSALMKLGQKKPVTKSPIRAISNIIKGRLP